MPPKLRYPYLTRDPYVVGSSMDWGRALPAVVRLLADRRAEVRLPASPVVRGGEDPDVTFNRALSYWTALDHVLRYQVGWAYPAQGLARWLDEGGGDLCEPLALVRHVWLGDGYLNRYMAWRVHNNHDHLPSAWMKRIGDLGYKPDSEGEPIGPWKLHLEEPGGHTFSPETGAPAKLAWLHPFDPPGARPTKPALVTEVEAVMLMRGSLETRWYGALQQAPTEQVRIVSEEHGLCGHFRRSQQSGRWHTVPEEIHLWGVRPGQDGPLS